MVLPLFFAHDWRMVTDVIKKNHYHWRFISHQSSHFYLSPGAGIPCLRVTGLDGRDGPSPNQ
jgi:hypothetical protein